MIVEEKEYRMLNIPSGDLRISVTNGCNMRCTYCHNEGQTETEVKYLSVNEVKTIVCNAMKFGLHKVRITGGEPLIHPNIEEILEVLRDEVCFSNVGLNTNGVYGEKLLLICERGLVNRVVVGIDYYDCEISKKSCIGVSSKQIKETVLQLKKMGVNVEVAVVFVQNSEEIFALVQWGLENQLVIKVIEKSDFWDHSFSEQPYNKLLLDIQKRFQLKLGITADLHEYYLSNGKTRVKFFQSHCNRNECGICQRLHMRVSCDGMAMPCINRADLTFPLLQGDFDENMNRAIANLGNRPGNDVV